MKTTTITIFSLFLFGMALQSAKPLARVPGPDSLLLGTWKGTSICQVKNSPCHDEVVVYHISKGKAPDAYDILANKIVNGAEEEIGVLPCTWNESSGQLVSTAHNGIWAFDLTPGKLSGTLIYRNQLYRVIDVSKTD